MKPRCGEHRLDRQRCAAPHTLPPAEPARQDDQRLAGRRYLLLSAGDMILTPHDSVLITLLPLWVVSTTTVAEAAVGPLLAANTLLTVVLQVPDGRTACRA